MARERISMRKLKEILRLKHECGLSNRQISKSCNIGRKAISQYCKLTEQCALSWAEAKNLTDAELEQRLYGADNRSALVQEKEIPDWNYIYQELKKPYVTLQLVWQEYKEQYPDGYQYSWFNESYSRWLKKRTLCMRQNHKSGEKVFVDYGDGISIVDKTTGELIPTQLFVGVWGASNYTYAEASHSQKQREWVMAHVRMFEHSGCVPRVIVPDNLKSGVSRACWYEPDINPTYLELARHYGCGVIPARPYKPKDKAKVEVGILIAKRWILASLRNKFFYSLSALNEAISILLEKLNTRRMQKIESSRKDLFERIDKPSALLLPDTRYEYTQWQKARVNIDYHIEVDKHYYSVPYQLVRETVDVRITDTIIEVLCKGIRQASHMRSFIKHRHTTTLEHMPEAHRKYLEWTPTRIIQWAGKIGVSTQEVTEHILQTRKYPEQGYRSCLGILRLANRYSSLRLERACKRAAYYRTFSYKSIKLILENGLDIQTKEEVTNSVSPVHKNVRGAAYYQGGDTHIN
ncbi:MAG: IS21 family transposase [bacterium]